MLKVLIVVHRWLGVALCALFLLWFPSGIGMMYWGMPAISARDRLERSPVLDPSTIALSPQEAAERIGLDPSPSQIRVTVFDGRPAYRVNGDVVYADNGEVQGPASREMRDRVAWGGRPHARRCVPSRVLRPSAVFAMPAAPDDQTVRKSACDYTA